MGRKRAFDATAIETKAMDYFWHHGFCSTSLDDLVSHLGISRSSLYSVWPSKDALFRAAFARYIQTVGMESLTPLTEVSSRTAREAVTLTFNKVAEQISHDPWQRGCLMVNTITELSAVNPELAQIAHDARTEVQKLFRLSLEPLVEAGNKTPKEADADADFLLTLFLGLRVLARHTPEADHAKQIVARGLASVFV
ncbi:MAG: TetR/AcrR family transcriptional regulator [Deinococcota bacterium]